MKSKKGFTLIELLAIIVILAVIAVITTPIILNVIENSKKGAAQDSALGYKDAVHKYYASRLSVDSSFQMIDGIYSIVNNGYLSDGTNTYEVQIDGKVPSNGFVQIERNKVVNACVGFDDYAVLISDGSISDALKGECTSVSEIVASGEEPLEVGTEYLFPYVSDSDDKEQTLEIVKSGYYKLEVWGAAGGSYAGSVIGGYGGYSTGVIYLTRGTKLYVNVGEKGHLCYTDSQANSYNGGGGCSGGGDTWHYARGGGGATHIALKTGVLSSLENDINKVLIVAGGGGGSYYHRSEIYGSGGSGGGFTGGTGTNNVSARTPATGGAQTTGGIGSINGSFGQGARHMSGGGGGFYGGGSTDGGSGAYNISGAGGGSGYIGNSRILDGVMYCYGCDESGGDGIKTISTTGNNKDSVSCPNGYSNSASSNCAKSEDGYAKVTYLGSQYSSPEINAGTKINFSYISRDDNKEQVMTVHKDGYYQLEVWGAQGGDGDSSRKGGYGGYSSGSVYLTAGTKLYVNVGGKGITNSTVGVTVAGGYNGGGENTASQWGSGSSGGGATHIALSSGTLASFDTNENGVADSNEIGNILIVAGGGGGSGVENGGSRYVLGGAAGGFKGNSSSIEDYEHIYGIVSGATQSTGYAFGQGGSTSSWTGGGGGGFYGGLGKTSTYFGGSGGSGYIGYSNLNNGVMYCYNCEENGDAGTRTISTTGSNKDSINCPSSYSSSALSNCAKAGNGYAVITYIGESLN